MSPMVYLNGQFMPLDEARIPVLDRGFIFGDGIYEVIPVYGGRPFRLPHHLDRLEDSLRGVRIVNPLDHAAWRAVIEQLITANGGGDQSIYLHITRGVAKRDHAFPSGVTPTLFAMSNPLLPVPAAQRAGIAAITVADIRWAHCNLKTIALLPNILLRQQAIDEGSSEALMLREGYLTEGAASNAFIVVAGEVVTPPKSALLLPGITRDLVVELCHAHAIPCCEREIGEAELRQAEEIWISSSTKEVLPVVRLDGEAVGSGAPGARWRQIFDLYQRYKEQFRAGEVA
jgi:D-alanine transaminase